VINGITTRNQACQVTYVNHQEIGTLWLLLVIAQLSALCALVVLAPLLIAHHEQRRIQLVRSKMGSSLRLMTSVEQSLWVAHDGLAGNDNE